MSGHRKQKGRGKRCFDVTNIFNKNVFVFCNFVFAATVAQCFQS